MRKKTAEFSDVSYYFGGEFRIYRHLFDARCPTPMKCLKGMIILRPGQTKGWMYYLCSGLLKVYMNNCEGNERSVAFITNDTLFGMDCFIPGQVSLTTIECMTDSWVMPFQSSVLEEIIRENADFAIDFARYYCKMLRQMCFDAENQSINNVLVRMVNFLLANWDDQDNSRVALSQQEIATAVSCSRSSVSRVCRLMKDEGAIVSEGVGFRIIDQNRMRNLLQRSPLSE